MSGAYAEGPTSNSFVVNDRAPDGMHARSQIRADVGPDFGAVRGAGDLGSVVGALLTYGLIVAVLMLIVSATTWAIASSSGSWHTAQKAKLGCLVAIGGAALTGAALTWANWLLDIGPHL
ncbi:DUF6112 family protein [Nocardioides albidus]|nr:DUF6112 family protein [Nocardioides albidus]